MNPHQEKEPDTFTLGEALRTMAERTAFRSETERDAVLGAIDKHIGDAQAEREEAEREEAERKVRDDEAARQANGDQGHDGPATPTPADTPAAKKAPAPTGRK